MSKVIDFKTSIAPYRTDKFSTLIMVAISAPLVQIRKRVLLQKPSILRLAVRQVLIKFERLDRLEPEKLRQRVKLLKVPD